ncbi:helix-turn-helix domain-containing protein [Pseudomonas sp. MWU13-2517]|uniref:helix-turn-helix domain-containing protein n=1 Tax=Pseudomonas sp. MWU13-2517 TaxID=2929055 RepID=UPI002010B5BB|nr:helix-turn-helix domain-containing protein [Pseudomonas sp. MWU13-2517]
MNITDLLERLKETSFEMTQVYIDEAILLHFDLIMKSYREKPFFYKNLLKYDRFMVALSLLSFSYKDEKVPLSTVKAFCQRRGYMSRNSLDTYFSFLVLSGYMDVQLHVQDGRQRSFQPTDKTLYDATQLIKSYLLPAQMISPYNSSLSGLERSANLLRVFARGFAKILESDLLLDKMLPEAKWILNRDGGHLPMLALYTDALRNGSLETGYNVSSYVQISSNLGVSKTHMQRMIKEGELQGYFKCNKRLIELSPAFVELMRRAMSICFSVSRVSMELGVAEYEDEGNSVYICSF